MVLWLRKGFCRGCGGRRRKATSNLAATRCSLVFLGKSELATKHALRSRLGDIFQQRVDYQAFWVGLLHTLSFPDHARVDESGLCLDGQANGIRRGWFRLGRGDSRPLPAIAAFRLCSDRCTHAPRVV